MFYRKLLLLALILFIRFSQLFRLHDTPGKGICRKDRLSDHLSPRVSFSKTLTYYIKGTGLYFYGAVIWSIIIKILVPLHIPLGQVEVSASSVGLRAEEENVNI